MAPVSLVTLLVIAALLLLAPGHEASSQKVCSYLDVLQHLKISKTNEDHTLSRPSLDYTQPTEVYLELALYGILDMVEKHQTFIAYILTVMYWHSDRISWEPRKFCNISFIPSVPKELLWKPDIIIKEMIAEDKGPPCPYISLNHSGWIQLHKGMVVVSTCVMYIYSFPFDTQRCNLSFESIVHTGKELKLRAGDTSKMATLWTREVLRTQDEWRFCHMKVTNSTSENSSDIIVFTITMKRRPVLYVVNLLLPIWFFMCLDVASLFISEKGGEKLSFKVTVMLSVTVLQLILNDILPSTSSRIPLIATYCMVIFALMLLSLCETILVMNLMEKDSHIQPSLETGCSEAEESKGDNDLSPAKEDDKDKDWQPRLHVCDGSISPTALGRAIVEEGEPRRPEDHVAVMRLLRDMRKALETHGHRAPGYWTSLAKRIHVVFIVLYISAIISFVCYMSTMWYSVIHNDTSHISDC